MFSNPSESIPCFFIFWLVFENNSDCSASRGTRRATAVYVIQFTREPARPASREARCRAAVTRSQPAFPHAAPRPMGAVWGAGVLPLPASREACCRAAVTPQPILIPSPCPAPHGRGVGCRGTAPALGEDAAEVFAGLLGGVDEEVPHVQLDGLARFHAHALVGVGNDAQLLAAAQIDATVVHIA